MEADCIGVDGLTIAIENEVASYFDFDPGFRTEEAILAASNRVFKPCSFDDDGPSPNVIFGIAGLVKIFGVDSDDWNAQSFPPATLMFCTHHGDRKTV